LKQKGR